MIENLRLMDSLPALCVTLWFFLLQGLTKLLVKDEKDINRLIAEGNKARYNTQMCSQNVFVVGTSFGLLQGYPPSRLDMLSLLWCGVNSVITCDVCAVYSPCLNVCLSCSSVGKQLCVSTCFARHTHRLCLSHSITPGSAFTPAGTQHQPL